MRKRIASIVLSVCLCLTLLPTAAMAEEPITPTTATNRTLMLGTSALKGGQKSNVYFGNYQQSEYAPTTAPDSPANDTVYTDSDGTKFVYLLKANKYYEIEAIKWRVLSNADGNTFLLSDKNLDVFQYNTKSAEVTWETSTMRSWLNGYDETKNGQSKDYTSDNFIKTAFSENELAHILQTTLENADNPDSNTEGGNNTDDYVFLLSIAEVLNTAYGFTSNTTNTSTRASTNTAYVAAGGKLGTSVIGVNKADCWWLRSPGNGKKYAAEVAIGGSVDKNGSLVLTGSRTVRPAFNLNLNSVLFTSAAVGGKSGTVGTISAIKDYDDNVWKLTLKDESRSGFSAEIFISTNRTVVSYKGATTGSNEYITAMVVNENDEVTYYGSLKNITESADTSGTIEIDLSDKMNNGDKVYILNEQWNGDYKTDYASAFKPVTLTVDNTAPTLTAGTASRTSSTNATVTFTSNEAGTYYYAVVDNGATAPTIDTSGEDTACDTSEQTISLTDLTTAGAKDIYIVAVDAAGNESNPLKITIPAYAAPSSDSSDPTYSVSVIKPEHGTVKTSHRTAESGERVTLTITPDEGYILDSLTVTDKNGNALELKDLGNGKYSFKMPASKVTVSATFAPEKTVTDYFADVPADSYYADAVLWAANKGITGGVDETHFAPDRTCTRAQIVTFLWRAAGSPAPIGSNSFTDVPSDAYYAKAVAWAVENCITTGVTANTFCPDQTCTRAQTVAFLFRYAAAVGGMDAVTPQELVSSYGDAAQVPGYALSAFNWALANGVVTGNNGNLMPNNDCTRAQIVTMLYRLLGK